MPHFEFKNAKTPYSSVYDDFYFAHKDGPAESQYVYLEGSGVRAAIRSGQKKIVVGEIGFGVGLNFLLTFQEWEARANREQTLEYWAVEKYPVRLEDLKKLYSAYPELQVKASELFECYPLLTPGVHRLHLAHGKVSLNLLIGDAADLFRRVHFQATHWYWDGFAPQKNPDAFAPELFSEVVRLSVPGAQGASFTAAGWVRRNLEEHGFRIVKRKGFGAKRECIQAFLESYPELKSSKNDHEKAWFSNEKLKRLEKGQTVAVIGAGLAGTAVARALAEQGFSVHVFDAKGVAARASSNSVGLFNVQLSKLPNPISRFSQLALAYFLRELKKLKLPHRLGILRQEHFTLESLENSHYPADFFETISEEEVYFAECGMLNPQSLCAKRLEHPLIQFERRELQKVIREKNGFRLHFNDSLGEANAEHVIYAVGSDSALGETSLDPQILNRFPIRPIRGQTILVKPSEKSRHLSFTRVSEGYASPVAPEITGHEFHLLGATYQAKNISLDQVALDTEKLMKESREKWPEFCDLLLSDFVEAKVGYRASTPDKLPLIGPLVDTDFLATHYTRALRGASPENLPPLEAIEGAWVCLGLGSRGITFSSLGAEILVSMMTGTSLPLELDLLPHLHPVRFSLRNLRKTTP